MTKQKDKCPDCDGRGELYDRPQGVNYDCPTCNGTGEKKLDRLELNITEATKRACEEPTLLDALSWISIWESERVVKQARANPRGWETCFKVCLQSVLDNFRKDRPEICVGCPTWDKCEGSNQEDCARRDRPEPPKEIPALCIVNMVEGRGYPNCVESLIEEARKEGYKLGVEHQYKAQQIDIEEAKKRFLSKALKGGK